MRVRPEQKPRPKVTLPQLMRGQGGVGYAQQMAFFLIELQIAAAGVLIYNLPYLLL